MNATMQKNNQIKRLLYSTLISTVILGSCSSPDSKQPAGAQSMAVPVDVLIAKTEDVSDAESIIASTASNHALEVVSEISKKIQSVNFKDGSSVQKGQLLYKLEDGDIRAKLKYAKAELELARMNEERSRKLLANEAIQPQEYDNVKALLDMAIARKELLDDELEKTEIRAPFSGKIGISNIKPGGYVTPGKLLVELQDLSTIKLNFSVSEKYVNEVIPGRKVEFTTALSDKKYYATITATAASVNSNSRSIDVQAVYTSGQGELKGGMSAKVLFEKHSGQKGVKVPTEALIPMEKGYGVFVVKNGLANMKNVAIVTRNESEAIVSEGVSNGDSIIVSNILRTSEGAAVQVITSKK